jgi:hypothetical protein
MTDEALFYRRFIDDVRRCAGGRTTASVAEIERRVRVAMIAPPSVRERRWARVVAAVNELLASLDGGDQAAARRLRAFVRENEDLGRPRDVAMSDFRLSSSAERVLVGADGRAYLLFEAPLRPATRPINALDEVVPLPTRRLTEALVYAICGGAAIAALWLAFVVPV